MNKGFLKIFSLSLFFTIALNLSLNAQQLKGTIKSFDKDKQAYPLVGANVFWKGTKIGTVTDENGSFVINKPNTDISHLIIMYLGFENDTITINSKQNIIKTNF